MTDVNAGHNYGAASNPDVVPDDHRALDGLKVNLLGGVELIDQRRAGPHVLAVEKRAGGQPVSGVRPQTDKDLLAQGAVPAN
ncbi:hypothetical protein D3C81_2159230 [compost metagenome]